MGALTPFTPRVSPRRLFWPASQLDDAGRGRKPTRARSIHHACSRLCLTRWTLLQRPTVRGRGNPSPLRGPHPCRFGARVVGSVPCVLRAPSKHGTARQLPRRASLARLWAAYQPPMLATCQLFPLMIPCTSHRVMGAIDPVTLRLHIVNYAKPLLKCYPTWGVGCSPHHGVCSPHPCLRIIEVS
jgi:hypothetical protein